MAAARQNKRQDVARGVGMLRFDAYAEWVAWLAILVISACAGIGVVVGYVIWFADPRLVDATWLWMWTYLLADVLQITDSQWRVDSADGPVQWDTLRIRNDPWFLEVKDHVLGIAIQAVWIGAMATVLTGIGLHWHAKRLGEKAREQQTIRGTVLVKDRQLASKIAKKGAGPFQIGNVALPAGCEVQHFMFVGSTGTGKSQAIMKILETAREQGHAALVYDRGGLFLERFFRAGDIVLNPLDARSKPWSPWAEIRSLPDADRVSEAFIPPGVGEGAFFHDAARTLLSAFLARTREMDDQSVVELMRLMFMTSREERGLLLRGTAAQKYFEPGAERSGQAIDTTMSTYARCLRYLPQTAGGDRDFSITRFIEDLDITPAPKPFIFITSREREHAALMPLITAWVDSAVAAILSLPPSSSRRIWCVLDEIASLQRIPSLETLMSEGRKYGAAVIAGTQAISRLHSVYGKNDAETLLSLFNTYAIYRSNDPTSTEWAVKKLGESEMERASEYLRYDPQRQDRMDLARQRSTNKLVLDSELTTLPDLECFLKVAGAWPLCRTAVPYQTRIMSRQSAQAFIEADIRHSVYYAMDRSPENASGPATSTQTEDQEPSGLDVGSDNEPAPSPVRARKSTASEWGWDTPNTRGEESNEPGDQESTFARKPYAAHDEGEIDDEMRDYPRPSVKSKQPAIRFDMSTQGTPSAGG